jgi:RNA polymerase sigma factor (sigma-70 family)
MTDRPGNVAVGRTVSERPLPAGPHLSRAGTASPGSRVKGADVEFEAVYRAERSRLMRYVMTMGADQYEADDAVQAAFAQAYPRWQAIRQPRAWLYKAALREYYRADNRRSRETPAGDALPEQAEPLDSGDIVVLNEEEEMVRSAVAALPGRQRQVMALTLAGFTPAEIAQQLGCDPAAVRQNQVRARASLARRLGIDRRDTR